MKKILALILIAAMLLNTALARELVLHATVLPGGPSAEAVTIVPDEAILASAAAKFSMEIISTRGQGPNARTVAKPLAVYEIRYAPDGSVTLVTAPFSPEAIFNITCALPGSESTLQARWSQEDVAHVRYDIADEFRQGACTAAFVDAAGQHVEASIVYRLYVPENPHGLPLVIALHGSGESGSDGLAHITASQLATCWADPAWQADHPCIILAPQWPDSGASNDPVLRDQYLALYRALIGELQAQYAPARTYLAALSMGTRLGLRYMSLYPDDVDAALLVCGSKGDADLSALTDPPIWLVHAASDAVVDAQGSVDAYHQLSCEAGNPNVRLTLLTDEKMKGISSHAAWQLVFGNEEYMEWLFRQ